MSSAGSCTTPVPVFTADPLTSAGFCAIRARSSISAALAQEIEDEVDRGQGGACCPPSAPDARAGATRSRKRKRARPTRSDDGCDKISYTPSSTNSSTNCLQLFACEPLAQVPRKHCPMRRKVTKRGLTAAQAILASERRRKDRYQRKSSIKLCAVMVSGMLLPMTPVPQLPVRLAM